MLRIKLIIKYCISCWITDILQNDTGSIQYQINNTFFPPRYGIGCNFRVVVPARKTFSMHFSFLQPHFCTQNYFRRQHFCKQNNSNRLANGRSYKNRIQQHTGQFPTLVTLCQRLPYYSLFSCLVFNRHWL